MKTQLFLGQKPLKKRMEDILNSYHCSNKPYGGMWTSTYDEEKHSSEWVQWTTGNSFYRYNKVKYLRWWLLTPKPGLRIYTVESLFDLKRLVEKYALQRPAYKALINGTIYQQSIPANIYDQMLLDYERIADYYDAIHLTSEGQWATRHTYPENLSHWSVESTLWLRWGFKDVVRAAVKSPVLV